MTTPETQAGREEPVWHVMWNHEAGTSQIVAPDKVEYRVNRWSGDATLLARRLNVLEARIRDLETVRGNQLALALEWGAKLTALEAALKVVQEGLAVCKLFNEHSDEWNGAEHWRIMTTWETRFYDALLTPDGKEASDA